MPREDKITSVGDVIEMLNAFDPNMPCMIYDGHWGEEHDVTECREVPADRVFNPPSKTMVSIR